LDEGGRFGSTVVQGRKLGKKSEDPHGSADCGEKLPERFT
jgi:hypothetical protein